MLTDRDEAIADQLRAILLKSSRWSALVAGLPMQAIAAHDPVDLNGCTAEEAFAIARWATDPDEDEMPKRLADYFAAVCG